MIKLEDINKNITFKEDTHQYFTKEGKELTSVSRVLGAYKNEFDPEGHIKRCVAKRDGLTTEQVSENWENTKNEGLERGKNFHRQIEHYIKTGEILKEDYEDVIKQFADIKFSGKLYSEVSLSNLSYNIAGTTDLIHLINDNLIELADFKTNKAFNIKSKYGNRLLYPLEKYWESEMDLYSFQLNIYSFMLEEHGFVTKSMTIYWVNPETRHLDVYPVPNLKEDTIKLLKHFRSMQEW